MFKQKPISLSLRIEWLLIPCPNTAVSTVKYIFEGIALITYVYYCKILQKLYFKAILQKCSLFMIIVGSDI